MGTKAGRKPAADTTERAPDFHWWARDTFIAGVTRVLAQLQADESRIPCMRLDRNTDGPTVWIYTVAPGKAVSGNGGDEGFDNSHPCPPFCPPGYP